MKIENLSRRQFLKGSFLAGGGLILGFSLPMVNKAQARQQGEEKSSYPMDAWIKVDPQGVVSFVIPVSEMGQGSQTALAMILSDEIGADYRAIKVLNPDNSSVFNNPIFGMQLTGGSTAVRAWWNPLREVGATLRHMMVQAAATKWQVSETNLTTRDSQVINQANGKKLHFRDLVASASDLTPPEKPALRPASQYQYIGKSMPRVDTPAKVTGEAVFGLDVTVPGMLIAAIQQSPVFGGQVDQFNKDAAMKVKGVKAVVNLESAVAVVANNYWQAQKGIRALATRFKGGDTRGLNSDNIEKSYREALANDAVAIKVFGEKDIKAALQSADKSYEMDYFAPFLAHSTMEPMNATAHVQDHKCEVWAPTQAQSVAVQAIAGYTGLQPNEITLHTTYLGGGFGRRAEIDYIMQAVKISEAIEAPVKLIWSREEDMQHDVYRPAAASRFKIGVDKTGYPVAWHNRVSNTSIMQRYAPQWLGDKPDKSMTEGAAETPYKISNQLTDVVQLDNKIPVGFWRSVGNSLNCFFLESALDELAHHAGINPLRYREKLLADSPRALNVLQTAAKLSGWNMPLPEGKGRGIALTHSFGSYVAEVAEVSVKQNRFTVDRVYCAVDCGLVINPSIVERQMQSAIIYGLTAALSGKINFNNGRVVESNFHDYPAMRLSETPEIKVKIIKSNEDPGGYGEPGTPPVAPAVANAVYAASGKRLRDMPFKLS